MTDDFPKLYTLAEAAALIHRSVKVNALRAAIADRKLTARKIGNAILVTEDAIREFLETSTCPARTEAHGSNSTALTTGTEPDHGKASGNTSGTSSGPSAGPSANVAAALQIAESLSKPLRAGSRRGRQPNSQREPAPVIPIR